MNWNMNQFVTTDIIFCVKPRMLYSAGFVKQGEVSENSYIFHFFVAQKHIPHSHPPTKRGNIRLILRLCLQSYYISNSYSKSNRNLVRQSVITLFIHLMVGVEFINTACLSIYLSQLCGSPVEEGCGSCLFFLNTSLI